MTVELKFLGKSLKVYRGMDGTTAIHLKAGDSIGVSEGKADKLLADYPDDFKRTSGIDEPDLLEETITEEPTMPKQERDDQEPEEKEPETVVERSKRTAKPSGKTPQKNKAVTPKRNKSFVPKNKRK